MRRNQPEANLQKACIKWFRLQYPQILIFAIPNEGRHSIQYRVHQARMGVVSGIPDLFIAHPRYDLVDYGFRDGGQQKIYTHGMFIEMKSKDGTVKKNQKTIMSKLKSEGFYCAVCRTIDEFVGEVRNYLKGENHG